MLRSVVSEMAAGGPSVLDPRSKLALLVVGFVLIILTPSLPLLLVESALLALVIAARRSLRAWLGLLKSVLVLALLLALFYWWAYDALTAVSGAIRLVLGVSAFWLFFQTTAPEDLADALAQSGVPYRYTFILTASMQFVPVLTRQVEDIFDAQRARGVRLELDLRSLPNFGALLAPLLVQSFALAEQLAEALEARGFGSSGRTPPRRFELRILDFVVVAGALGTGAAVLFLLR